jgi:hypothetical protein
MATNLRLSEQAAAAVKAEAERTGRSQQDVIRSAVDQYLSAPQTATPASNFDRNASVRDQFIPPRTPFSVLPKDQMLKLPDGVTSLDLLDREDRV